MQLVMRRYRLERALWYNFRINARLVIDKEQESLLDKYRFGTMENRPRLSDAEYEELLALNRSRYCASAADQHLTRKPVRPEGFELGRLEVF